MTKEKIDEARQLRYRITAGFMIFFLLAILTTLYGQMKWSISLSLHHFLA